MCVAAKPISLTTVAFVLQKTNCNDFHTFSVPFPYPKAYLCTKDSVMARRKSYNDLVQQRNRLVGQVYDRYRNNKGQLPHSATFDGMAMDSKRRKVDEIFNRYKSNLEANTKHGRAKAEASLNAADAEGFFGYDSKEARNAYQEYSAASKKFDNQKYSRNAYMGLSVG